LSSARLSPFSFAILVLVGRGGAGPHDLRRMAERGRVYWDAAPSQWYAEPKRLAEHGYLEAHKAPGRTRERTHYTLTERGRDALREWLATPVRFARIQNEPVVRVLGAEFVEKSVLLASLEALRTEIDELTEGLDRARGAEPELPHRAAALRINQRLARRILDAHRQWLDEVEAEL
jgi:DNA-binding PadR family transcriptional regulator